MPVAKVFFNTVDRFCYSTKDSQVFQVVDELREAGAFRYFGLFNTDLDGADAAEELFDLSNNPNREVERAKRWGPGRSLSVGDLVQVNDVCWFCAPVGWQRVW